MNKKFVEENCNRCSRKVTIKNKLCCVVSSRLIESVKKKDCMFHPKDNNFHDERLVEERKKYKYFVRGIDRSNRDICVWACESSEAQSYIYEWIVTGRKSIIYVSMVFSEIRPQRNKRVWIYRVRKSHPGLLKMREDIRQKKRWERLQKKQNKKSGGK